MQEYMEHYPKNADLGFVFRDLHAKADRLISDLGVPEEAEGEGATQPVPGTELGMRRTSVEDSQAEGVNTNTHVSVGVDDASRQLISVTDFKPEGEDDPIPKQVDGYRGEEMIGDYSITQLNNGLIVVRLDERGAESRPNEPLGILELGPSAKLKMFNDIDLRRVELVINGIMDNIAVARLIRGGTPPEEAFAMVDRLSVTA